MKNKKNKSGSGLLVSFIMIFLISIICASMQQYSSQQTSSVRRTTDFLKAKSIAESGINYTYNNVKFNFNYINNPNLSTNNSFGDGFYTVKVLQVSTNTAYLVSVGTCGNAKAKVSADLLNQRKIDPNLINNENMIDEALFKNYSIIAGGKINWAGTGNIIGGKVRGCGPIELFGNGKLSGSGMEVISSKSINIQGNAEINGIARSAIIEGKIENITTKVKEPVLYIKTPNLDLYPYYQIAYFNNQIKTGSIIINKNFTPLGGILWVDGSVKISNGSFNGCIVATGDIEISTSANINSLNGCPVLISRDGNIKITSTPTISGLVYTKTGNIEWQGGGVLNGAIISTGDVIKGGSSDLIINFIPSTPVVVGMPEYINKSGDYVIISAWQQ
jgi:hypothetical protein